MNENFEQRGQYGNQVAEDLPGGGRFLSFNRAAEHLNYAPSTVSAQIRSLEEELEVPLFDRLGKKVVLTGAGNLLMQYSKRSLPWRMKPGRRYPDGKRLRGC